MNRPFVRFAAAFAVLFAFAVRVEAQSQPQKPLVQFTVKSAKDFMTKVGELSFTVKKVMEGENAEPPEITKQLGQAEQTMQGFDLSKPLGLRIMYKAPPPNAPIDGDILFMIPVTDANKFNQLLTQAIPGFKTENNLSSFQPPGVPIPIKFFGRTANNYSYWTVMDSGAVFEDRLPKPADVFGSPTHDITLSLNPGVIPEAAVKNIFNSLRNMIPAGQGALDDSQIQQYVDLNSMTIHFDADTSSNKIIVEIAQSYRPSSKLAGISKNVAPGPLRSAIGVHESAIMSAGMRGDAVAKSGMFSNTISAIKSNPQTTQPIFKEIVGLLETLAATELEDVGMSVAPDGTIFFAAAVQSAAAFELKINELTMEKKSVKVGEDKLTKIVAALPGDNGKANIYLGAKDNVAFVAISFVDGTKTIEEALKRKPIESHDPLSMVVKLKECAEALGVSGYSGSGVIKAESKKDPTGATFEIPVKDMAELAKAGFFKKLEEFGKKFDGS